MKPTTHAQVRGLGFRSLQHFHQEVSGVDLSTKPRAKRFRLWKKNDGTLVGLQRLGEIKHLENWPTKLNDFIDSCRTKPFEWGQHDCCLFAANAVQATTGIDPAAGTFRGKYKTNFEALRLVRRFGGIEKLAAKVCARFEFPPVKVTLAQRGDMVLLKKKQEDPVMGICLGRISAFPAMEGLRFVSTSECSKAWKIGGTA